MKNTLLFLVFLTFCSSVIAQKYNVQLKFVFKQPYCGGARPSAEILSEAEKERGLDKHTFYVYKKNKCIDSVKTDDNGIANLNIKCGSYTLIEAWKHFKRTPDNNSIKEYDKACLKKEWKMPNYKLFIKTEKDFKLDLLKEVIRGICFYKYPCLLQRHLPE
ncbi:MAG: hypothetical protein SFY56_09380 [Bacteroidota bacterium]|nr:hypothetical protein [Bacteroidota bacterium]